MTFLLSEVSVFVMQISGLNAKTYFCKQYRYREYMHANSHPDSYFSWLSRTWLISKVAIGRDSDNPWPQHPSTPRPRSSPDACEDQARGGTRKQRPHLVSWVQAISDYPCHNTGFKAPRTHVRTELEEEHGSGGLIRSLRFKPSAVYIAHPR